MTLRPVLALATSSLLLLALGGCAPATPTVSLRLWDPYVADAYRESLDRFETESGIAVEIVVVPWADYWTQLRLDIASGTVDDVFWTNAANFQDYALSDRLIPVSPDQLAAQGKDWPVSVVEQYSLESELWGVPQITDPGIALLYNADLLEQAGIPPSRVEGLSWDPSAPDDELREVARLLTLDAKGRHPGDAGFDARRVSQYGFGAANDLNAVLLQFLAGNGAAWQRGDEFVFADDRGIAAVRYLVELIGVEQVAPPAADTNPPAGGDFLRDQFLQGRIALFPTGAYHLAAVDELADFDWGIAPFPAGPAGALSVTNGIIAAASADSDATAEQRALLDWLGSSAGQEPIGRSGAALPASLDAQQAYADSWAERGIDLDPMLDILDNGSVQAPQGSRYTVAAAAMEQTLNSIFLGRTPPEVGLPEAQRLANAELR